MLYIDIKYINMCGASLRNFKKKSQGSYNCSCPLCGDSQKNLSKARGYFLSKNNRYWFHCHNCQASLSLASFLKKQFPLFYQEYILEKYKDNKQVSNIPIPVVQVTKLKKMSSSYSQSIDLLSDDHYAKQYIKSRMIPEDKLSLIYYTDDFAQLAEDLFPGRYGNLPQKDPRIVLPFFDKSGDVIGVQGRSLDGDSKLRYVTARASEDTALIYGLERLDLTKKVLVVEGPIDSLFLPNAIAVASSDLQRALRVVPSIQDYILVFDNEPRNKEIVQLMENAIESGKIVCIWPKMYQDKDINDMVRSGHDKEDIVNSILNSSYSGLRAKMKLTEWRKC